MRETQDLINRAGKRESKSAASASVQQEKKAADDTLGILRTVEEGRQAFVQSRIASAEKETASVIGNVQKQAAATVSAKKKEDAAYKAAMADIKRLENERKRINEQTSRAIETQAKKEADARIREARRAASEILQSLRGTAVGGVGGGGGRGGRGGDGGGGAFFGGSLAGFAGAGPFVSAIGVGLGLTIFAVTAKLKEGAEAWVNYASKIENARIAFTTMLGSVQLANTHLKDLQQFALTTPFAFDELVQASQKMQALGFSADEVVPVLRDVGNAVAAVAGGSDELSRVIKALSDVRAKEKLQMQEVRQFAEAGISVYKILQAETGKSVVEIQKMIEAGEITSTIFENAFRKFSQAKYGDMMEKQSRTFTGAMSNIRDVLLQTADTAFEPLFRQISQIAARTQEELQKASNLDEVGTILADSFFELGSYLGERLIDGIMSRVISPSFWKRYIDQLPRTLMAITRGIEQGIQDAVIAADIARFKAQGGVIGEEIRPSTRFGVPAEIGTVMPGSRFGLGRPVDSTKTTEAQAEKSVTILKEVQRQLVLTADASRELTLRQKLLAEGISEVNNEAAQEALEWAKAQDRILKLIESSERLAQMNARGAEIEAARNAQLRKSLDDILDPVGEVNQRIADLIAEETGGRSEVEKFNAVLGLQARTFLGLTQEALTPYEAKIAEIDKRQAENTIAKRIQDLDAEVFRLTNTVDDVLPPLKEYELWLKLNAQTAKLGKDRLEDLKNAFLEAAKAAKAADLRKQREDLQKSLLGIGRDIDKQFQRLPDDEITKLAEKLQGLSILQLQPFSFDRFIRRIRDGAIEGQEAIDLIAGAISQGNLGPELESTAKRIVDLFVKAKNLSEFLAREDATAKYTQLVAELSLVLETDAVKTHSSQLAKELLKDSYKSLTNEQRRHLEQLALEADAAEHAREAQERRLEVLRDIASDLAQITTDITDSIGQGVDKFFDSIRRQAMDLAHDIKEQIFSGLFEALLTGEARQGTGLAGVVADKILGGLGIRLGSSQEAIVADNTQATRDNTAALNANTRTHGGVPSIGSGIPGVADILSPFLNLIPRRAQGGSTEAGKIYRINDRFTARRVELFRPSVNGQVLSLGEENTALSQRGSPTVVESRTIVALGDKAVREAQESYGRTRDGRRAQLVNARWHRKVLSFA